MTNANMLMYWHLLQRTIQRGNRTFDFGRSSESSGTYRFKRQWGATRRQLIGNIMSEADRPRTCE